MSTWSVPLIERRPERESTISAGQRWQSMPACTLPRTAPNETHRQSLLGTLHKNLLKGLQSGQRSLQALFCANFAGPECGFLEERRELHRLKSTTKNVIPIGP